MTTPLFSQTFPAQEILSKTLQTHGNWEKWQHTSTKWTISIQRKGVADRYFNVFLDYPTNQFVYAVQNDSISYRQGLTNGTFWSEVNKKHRAISAPNDLTPERTTYLKEVYFYLLGLPMVLEKDTSYLDSHVQKTRFHEHTCYVLTFRYQPEEENETWEFYIDETSFQLVGYRFYLKEPSTNGEFIYLDEYKKWKGFLIPFKRTWFWNKDASYFRTDQIHEVKAVPKKAFKQ